jgi:hypothetical protein
MKYSLVDSSGGTVVGNADPLCAQCSSGLQIGKSAKRNCPSDGKVRRCGVLDSAIGRVFLCSPVPDDVKSKGVFQLRIEVYLSAMRGVAELRASLAASFDARLERIIHNLTSLNARSIQEFYALFSQELLTKQIDEQIQLIEETMIAMPEDAARAFLRIAKNSLAMKSEFVSMRFLGDHSTSPHLKNHDIRKVVLNLLHVFLQDFAELRVKVKVSQCSTKVALDYDTFHSAVYHVLDNAAKYVMPDSDLLIDFRAVEGQFRIEFSMFSLKIRDQEVARIGDEGFSGSLPQSLGKAGHGLGMFRTKRLLKANVGAIEIKPNVAPDRATTYNGNPYEENQIIIVLKELRGRGRTIPVEIH